MLLLRYEDHGRVFWATPGGSLEDGEAFEDAARREVREELGAGILDLSPVVAERSCEHPVGTRDVLQVERYYVATIGNEDVDPALAAKPDGIAERRWWMLDELLQSTETVYPAGLADLISSYLEHGLPAARARLSS